MSDQNQTNPPAGGKIPRVDPDLCIGCGLCVTTCPDVFALADDGKSYVQNPSGCAKCNCQEAIDSCPSHAISWLEQS